MRHGTAKAPDPAWQEQHATGDDVCLHLLLLDDSSFDAELLPERLRRDGLRHTLRRVATEAAFRRALDHPCDLVVAEVALQACSAGAALAVLALQGGAIPLVVLTADVDETGLAELIRAGAVDYVLKTRLGRLTQALRLAVDRARLITWLEPERPSGRGSK